MNCGDTTAWMQLGQGDDIISSFAENEDMLMIDLSILGSAARWTQMNCSIPTQ